MFFESRHTKNLQCIIFATCVSLQGFDYLYLTEADFTSFPSGAVIGKFVPGVGYALDAVVGQGLSYLGLGVTATLVEGMDIY